MTLWIGKCLGMPGSVSLGVTEFSVLFLWPFKNSQRKVWAHTRRPRTVSGVGTLLPQVMLSWKPGMEQDAGLVICMAPG